MSSPVVDSYQKIFATKQRILAVFAHPDDLEIYCGGTIARLIADGKRVRSVKMTSGDMGSRQEQITQAELRSLRETEDTASMTTLGISPQDNIYLRFGDGQVENNLDTIGALVRQIRLFQPDLIITHNPQDHIIRFDQDNSWLNHRDHRHTGSIVLDAAYPYARDLLFYPQHFQEAGAKSWACSEFLLVDSYQHPDNVYVEMTEFQSQRITAHSQHRSQYSPEAAQESADFFTAQWDPQGQKNFEIFRHLIVD